MIYATDRLAIGAMQAARAAVWENQQFDDSKNSAGKTDYHTMGACHEVVADTTA